MSRRIFKKISVFGLSTLSACLLFLTLVFIPGLAHVAQAATLTLSPNASKVSVGNIVSVNVLVNSSDAPINTAASTIQFPTDLLEVVSVSQNSSIFSLWVQNPVFSNSAGTVTFAGGLPSPGFSGTGGQIMSIVFRVKKQGNASLIFSNSSVLANDGLGTDVLTATQPGIIQIGGVSQTEVPPVTTVANSLPPLPLVASLTQPDQSKWYSGTVASFSWNAPSAVTSIQTLLSKSASAVPSVTYDNSVSERTVSSLADGILYFNIRYINGAGTGPTAHYKVQIDSTPPEKFILNVAAQGVENVLKLDAFDAMSGVDQYSIKIDDKPSFFVPVSSLTADQYFLPIQNQGQHGLAVLAYDKAGNFTESDASFMSPAIVPPTIGIYPVSSAAQTASVIVSTEVQRGEAIMVKGESQYPNTAIVVFVQPEGKEIVKYAATTTADGSYSMTTDPLSNAGRVDAWSQLVFSDTVQSPLSDRTNVQVEDPLIVQSGKSLIYMLAYVLPASLLLMALLFMLYFGWHKFFGLKRRIQRETQGTIEDIHRALVVFKEELQNQLSKLEKVKQDRDLNRKEEKIFKELQGNIDSIDEFIEKKINKIK